MLKYSLGTLFVVTAIAAISSAAVANYSPVWAEVMVTATAGILLLGLLTAILGRDNARTFAIGFAVVGWVYFSLAFVEAVGLRGHLLTSRAVNRLFQVTQEPRVTSNISLPGAVAIDFAMPIATGTMPGQGNSFTFSTSGLTGTLVLDEAPRELHDIAHCIWALVLALFGGMAAQVIQRVSRKVEVAA